MKKMYIRLDDACPKRDKAKWERIENLLIKYNIKPLVGVIPDCKDPDMSHYEYDEQFWTKTIPSWIQRGWILALHGYQHIFHTDSGGLNPVNRRSEFAGVPLEEQKEMIRNGVRIMREYDVDPKVFFAPAHTYDKNTLIAIKAESNIKYISDTPANNIYMRYGLVFIPQQSGNVRDLPFKTITFCYHPNNMNEDDYDKLELFLHTHKVSDYELVESQRKLNIYDRLLMRLYYWRHNG